MRLFPLDPLAAGHPGPVDRGWAQALRRGPRTVEEVLADAARRMEEQDQAEAYQRDPLAYVRAERRRSNLWHRLFG